MKVAIYALGVLGAVGLALFGAFLSTNHKTLANWTLFATVVVCALGVALYWQDQIWLDARPSSEPPAPSLEAPTFQERVEKFTLSLGAGINVRYSLSDMEKGPKEPFNFGGFKPIRFYVDNGKFYADVGLYGGSGLPPVEVKHNEFIVRPMNWDRNSDKNALEVVNELERPIFQLVYRSPGHVVINGIFQAPGWLVLANEDGATTIANPPTQVAFALKRIFKYPSWKYPGQHEQ